MVTRGLEPARRSEGEEQPVTTLPREGDVVGNRFRIEGVLGRGGMGVVFAATHVSLGTSVALKWLPEATDAQARERLRREAKALVALDHPRVVRVIDVEILPQAAWLVMERLEGETLREQLGRLGALGVGETLSLAHGLVDGLSALHAAGLVHRDVKPSNLFLVGGDVGGVKIVDLGIARLGEGLADETLTATAAVFGSPRYMSPEQLRDAHRVDARADIWSLGVVLYEALAGRTPFAGESASAVTMAIATDEPVRLSVLRPDVPRPLELLIHACLQKRADDRPASMDAVRAALEGHAREADRRPRRLPLVAAGGAALLAAAFVLAGSRTAVESAGTAPPLASVAPSAGPALSPDVTALSAGELVPVAGGSAAVAAASAVETATVSGSVRRHAAAPRSVVLASPTVSVPAPTPLGSARDGAGTTTKETGDADLRATSRRR